MTEVHLYETRFLEDFTAELDSNTGIGKMLSIMYERYGDVDFVLCDGSFKPIAMKREKFFYDFGFFYGDILEKVPTYSGLSELRNEETIVIAEKYRKEDDASVKKDSATRLLKEKLVSHNKEVGVFFTDNKKLATLILPHGIKEAEVYVAENAREYTEIMAQINIF